MGAEPSGDIFARIPKVENFSFAANTTYGCGGCARRAYFPRTEEEACRLFSALSECGEKFVVLGNGSNVLAQDGLYDGAVVSTKNLKKISFVSRSQALLYCGSGVTVAELLNFCTANGLGGAEFTAGIPATLGGLVYMNGGAGGGWIGDIVNSVRIFDGKLRVLSQEECNFSYKHSTMRDINSIILGVNLQLTHSNAATIQKNIKDRLLARSAVPSGKSCGCVFKNYFGVSAGSIIESAGLKGKRIGNAVVSEKHCNFILNCGGKKSSDIYALINFVKDEVYKKFGVTLEEEVCYIGDFR